MVLINCIHYLGSFQNYIKEDPGQNAHTQADYINDNTGFFSHNSQKSHNNQI